jgi:hypothetical protein
VRIDAGTLCDMGCLLAGAGGNRRGPLGSQRGCTPPRFSSKFRTSPDEVADDAVEMTAYEDFVVKSVRAGETIIGLYPCTKDEHRAAFTKWRQDSGL